MSHRVGSVYIKSTQEIVQERSSAKRAEVLFILGELVGGLGFLACIYFMVRLGLSL